MIIYNIIYNTKLITTVLLFLNKFIEETILIDILSDTHFDSWFGYKETPSKECIVGFWRGLKPKGDYLIVAGDIGHNILQNIHILKVLKEEYYKEIIITLGNHDYFLIGVNILIDARTKALKEKSLYLKNNIFVLDGTIVALDGVKFGGAMGWYNNAYIVKNRANLMGIHPINKFNSINKMLQDMWQYHPDYKGTLLDCFDELFEEQYTKLKAVHQSCDVMVSHFNPTTQMEFQTKGWEKDPTTSFFCFDGEDLAIQTTAKLWIYGHTHERKTYIWHNKKFITSALGYKSEHYKGKIVTIEII